MEIKPIAYIKNDYDGKFAVPRQSNIAQSIQSSIVFCDEYAKPEAIKGIDGFSHLWLIWEFHQNSHEANSLTVRPPRLGGNKRVGVFASRSPYRPNPLGLSAVKLEKIEYTEDNKPLLLVSGADLVNGTPIYDIKPYIRFSDSYEDAVSGFVDSEPFHMLTVEYDDQLTNQLPKEKFDTLIDILSNDPRPAYQKDEDRIYGFAYAKKEIKFKVNGDILTILEITDGQ